MLRLRTTMDWERLPTIKSDRVCLRLLTSKDVDSLFQIFSNPEVTRYWSTPPLADREAAAELLNEIKDGFGRHVRLYWGIVRLPNDELIGTTTLFNLNFDSGRAEIGYGLGRAYWGNGYMNEALHALLRYAFEILNFRRLEADVDPRNTNSIRTIERLGFQREGFLRERWCVAGEIQDTIFYGLLRREWEDFRVSNRTVVGDDLRSDRRQRKYLGAV